MSKIAEHYPGQIAQKQLLLMNEPYLALRDAGPATACWSPNGEAICRPELHSMKKQMHGR